MTEQTPSVDTTVTLEVPLRALRQAIASVLPHAEPTKTGDEVGDCSRLRLIANARELERRDREWHDHLVRLGIAPAAADPTLELAGV